MNIYGKELLPFDLISALSSNSYLTGRIVRAKFISFAYRKNSTTVPDATNVIYYQRQPVLSYMYILET